MNLLLDTHIFLWYISGDSRLPIQWKDAIQNSENQVYFSSVSLWECIVKFALGQLPLPEAPHTYLPRQRAAHLITSLVLDEASVTHFATLPLIHRDPFDRMLICQAIQYNLTLVSREATIRSYAIPMLEES